MSCNRDDFVADENEDDNTVGYLYISDDTISDVNAGAWLGSFGVATIGKTLAAAGITISSETVATLSGAAFIVAAYWTWIWYTNDGCGVKIQIVEGPSLPVCASCDMKAPTYSGIVHPQEP